MFVKGVFYNVPSFAAKLRRKMATKARRHKRKCCAFFFLRAFVAKFSFCDKLFTCIRDMMLEDKKKLYLYSNVFNFLHHCISHRITVNQVKFKDIFCRV